MRYAVISKGLPLQQLEAEAKKAGAVNLRKTKLLGQLYCELDEEQAKKLSQVHGLKVKPVKEYHTDQVITEAPVVETISDVFYLLRSYFSPPLTGTGLTVAILDSGIRKSHQSLKNKVVYEANFTESLSVDDVFGLPAQMGVDLAFGIPVVYVLHRLAPGVGEGLGRLQLRGGADVIVERAASKRRQRLVATEIEVLGVEHAGSSRLPLDLADVPL